MSINAGETEVLLPAFYLKQHVLGRELLPMQSSRVSFARLLLILVKVSMWILSVCLKRSKMNEKPIITTFPMQRGFPATYGNDMICPLLARRSCLAFCARSLPSCSLSHAATWVLWIAFLGVRWLSVYFDLCLLLSRRYRPATAPVLCGASETHVDEVPFWVSLSRLTAQVSLRSTAFPTPHGWCGRAPYNRAGGWGYLSAIILLKRGVGRL